MVALVVILTVVVALLALLVAGLLRSHADILRALHSVGAGVGDPTATDAAASAQVPVSMGPRLPPERHSSSAPPLTGVTPSGDARAVAFDTGEALTLLAFLSSGCASCGEFWRSLRTSDQLPFPDDVRLVVVTKGPELEIAGEVARQAGSALDVVMSTDAWGDYEVPGSPFFVLIDEREGRRIGEGVANHLDQVADLVRRAEVDARGPRRPRDAAAGLGLDGPERESANDHELLAAGIRPGDPSLYPRSLDDVYGPTGRTSGAA